MYTQGEERDYVPKFQGNREKPAHEQIVLVILSPTERDRRDLFLMPVNPGESEEQYHSRLQDFACAKFVRAVRNCRHRGRDIVDGAALTTFGHPKLVAEAYVEAMTELSLSEEEKKTSETPSASSSSETPPFDGTAETAESAASIASADAASTPLDSPASLTSSSASDGSPDVPRRG